MWYRFASSLKQELFELSDKQFANADEFNRYLNDVLKRLDIPPKQLTGYKFVLAKCSDLSETQMVDLARRLSKMYGSKLQVSRLGNGSLRVNDLILNNSLDFLSAIHAKESKEMRKNDPDGKNEPTVMSGGDGIEIIPIDSEEEAIEVGKRLKFPGTPWCITWKVGNLYMNYRTIANSTFYIIINHNLPIHDNHHAVALRVTDGGLFYTNFSNSNGDQGDGEKLLKNLGLNPADFPLKPLSEEERVEHEAIKHKNQSLNKFKELENIQVNGKILPNVLNHYVQRHPVTDQQLEWLIDNGRRDVINDLVNNDYGMPHEQRKLLTKDQLESYKRKKKIVVEALIENGQEERDLQKYSNGDPQMQEYAGNYIMNNLENLKQNQKFEPYGYSICIPEDNIDEYVEEMEGREDFDPVFMAASLYRRHSDDKVLKYIYGKMEHPNFDFGKAMYQLPDEIRDPLAIMMKDHPDFDFESALTNLEHKRQFIEEMIGHKTFKPSLALQFVPISERMEIIRKIAKQPGLNVNTLVDLIPKQSLHEFYILFKDHPTFRPGRFLRQAPANIAYQYAMELRDHPDFDFEETMIILDDYNKFKFVEAMADHPKFDFREALNRIPDAQKLNFALRMKNHPKFDFYTAMNGVPQDQTSQLATAMVDHPKFDPLEATEALVDDLKLPFVNSIKDHPKLKPGEIARVIPEEQRLEYLRSMKDHQNFDFREAAESLSVLKPEVRLGFFEEMKGHPKYDQDAVDIYTPGFFSDRYKKLKDFSSE